MADYMVTTIDNPWNPFVHYHEWLSYDMQHGYFTDQWMYVLTKTSNDLRPEEIEEQIDAGVTRLLEIDPYGLHVKVYEDEAEEVIPMYNKVYRENEANLAPSST